MKAYRVETSDARVWAVEVLDWSPSEYRAMVLPPGADARSVTAWWDLRAEQSHAMALNVALRVILERAAPGWVRNVTEA